MTKKKPDYYYSQSCVIPYVEKEGITEFVVISSRKKKRWIFPKGIIEPGLSPGESALKEAYEEAGITGIIESYLGNFNYKKWGGKCKVEVYLMRVEKILEEWPESFRDREICNITKALDMIDEKALRKILKKL